MFLTCLVKFYLCYCRSSLLSVYADMSVACKVNTTLPISDLCLVFSCSLLYFPSIILTFNLFINLSRVSHHLLSHLQISLLICYLMRKNIFSNFKLVNILLFVRFIKNQCFFRAFHSSFTRDCLHWLL